MIFCIMVSFVQTTNLYNGIIRAIVETNYNAPTQIFINQTIKSITSFHDDYIEQEDERREIM